VAELDKSDMDRHRTSRATWFALLSGIATGYLTLLGLYYLFG
jgi:hypothetical protein